MIKSDSIIKIAPALLKAQKEIGAATKGATNPFFHSTYADLGSVMEACKVKLNENGITVLQPVGTDEGGVFVETVLLHESGEFIADRMRISVKQANDPQAQGSAITYARRYGLQSMVFIPSEDDDAEKATSHPEAPTAPTNAEVKTGMCLHQKGNVTKIAGPTSKHPGAKYEACLVCGKFLNWTKVEEEELKDPVNF